MTSLFDSELATAILQRALLCPIRIAKLYKVALREPGKGSRLRNGLRKEHKENIMNTYEVCGARKLPVAVSGSVLQLVWKRERPCGEARPGMRGDQR